jgi:hypothetical protein
VGAASCGPQEITLWLLQGEFVMEVAENRNGSDTIPVRNQLTDRSWRDTIGNPKAETRMWATTIVMLHPLDQYSPQMPLVQRDHEVQTLTTRGANSQKDR